MKYQIWSDKSIKELENEANGLDKDGQRITKSLLSLIHEANIRHNTKMLEREIEYLRKLNEKN